LRNRRDWTGHPPAIRGIHFTSGHNKLPSDFSPDLKLVASKNPQLKRVRIDLELWQNGEMIAAGTSTVNQAFAWHGLRSLSKSTQTSVAGLYAGIQMQESGVPHLDAGFLIFCL